MDWQEAEDSLILRVGKEFFYMFSTRKERQENEQLRYTMIAKALNENGFIRSIEDITKRYIHLLIKKKKEVERKQVVNTVIASTSPQNVIKSNICASEAFEENSMEKKEANNLTNEQLKGVPLMHDVIEHKQHFSVESETPAQVTNKSKNDTIPLEDNLEQILQNKSNVTSTPLNEEEQVAVKQWRKPPRNRNKSSEQLLKKEVEKVPMDLNGCNSFFKSNSLIQPSETLNDKDIDNNEEENSKSKPSNFKNIESSVNKIHVKKSIEIVHVDTSEKSKKVAQRKKSTEKKAQQNHVLNNDESCKKTKTTHLNEHSSNRNDKTTRKSIMDYFKTNYDTKVYTKNEVNETTHSPDFEDVGMPNKHQPEKSLDSVKPIKTENPLKNPRPRQNPDKNALKKTVHEKDNSILNVSKENPAVGNLENVIKSCDIITDKSNKKDSLTPEKAIKKKSVNKKRKSCESNESLEINGSSILEPTNDMGQTADLAIVNLEKVTKSSGVITDKSKKKDSLSPEKAIKKKRAYKKRKSCESNESLEINGSSILEPTNDMGQKADFAIVNLEKVTKSSGVITDKPNVKDSLSPEKAIKKKRVNKKKSCESNESLEINGSSILEPTNDMGQKADFAIVNLEKVTKSSGVITDKSKKKDSLSPEKAIKKKRAYKKRKSCESNESLESNQSSKFEPTNVMGQKADFAIVNSEKVTESSGVITDKSNVKDSLSPEKAIQKKRVYKKRKSCESNDSFEIRKCLNYTSNENSDKMKPANDMSQKADDAIVISEQVTKSSAIITDKSDEKDTLSPERAEKRKGGRKQVSSNKSNKEEIRELIAPNKHESINAGISQEQYPDEIEMVEKKFHSRKRKSDQLNDSSHYSSKKLTIKSNVNNKQLRKSFPTKDDKTGTVSNEIDYKSNNILEKRNCTPRKTKNSNCELENPHLKILCKCGTYKCFCKLQDITGDVTDSSVVMDAQNSNQILDMIVKETSPKTKSKRSLQHNKQLLNAGGELNQNTIPTESPTPINLNNQDSGCLLLPSQDEMNTKPPSSDYYTNCALLEKESGSGNIIPLTENMPEKESENIIEYQEPKTNDAQLEKQTPPPYTCEGVGLLENSVSAFDLETNACKMSLTQGSGPPSISLNPPLLEEVSQNPTLNASHNTEDIVDQYRNPSPPLPIEPFPSSQFLPRSLSPIAIETPELVSGVQEVQNAFIVNRSCRRNKVKNRRTSAGQHLVRRMDILEKNLRLHKQKCKRMEKNVRLLEQKNKKNAEENYEKDRRIQYLEQKYKDLKGKLFAMKRTFNW